MPPRPTKSRPQPPRAHYHHLATSLRGLEEDLRWGLDGSARIPKAWEEIALGAVAPHKVPVNIRMDADVVQFFRAMGAGHLTRMNAVLRAFMHARLAGVVPGPEAVVYAPDPEEEARALRREILDTAHREQAARDAAAAGLSDVDKRRARLEELRALRDARMGR